jgi:hypothetical protein
MQLARASVYYYSELPAAGQRQYSANNVSLCRSSSLEAPAKHFMLFSYSSTPRIRLMDSGRSRNQGRHCTTPCDTSAHIAIRALRGIYCDVDRRKFIPSYSTASLLTPVPRAAPGCVDALALLEHYLSRHHLAVVAPDVTVSAGDQSASAWPHHIAIVRKSTSASTAAVQNRCLQS